MLNRKFMNHVPHKRRQYVSDYTASRTRMQQFSALGSVNYFPGAEIINQSSGTRPTDLKPTTS
jgi:hypothetical protein